jgi:flagellar hook assembly protein FlgD
MGFENSPGENHIYRMSDAVITDILEQPIEQISSNIKLQATPNPFNSQTTLVYSLQDEGRITVKIYDILGREVLTLLDNTITTGKQSIYWNGSNSNGEKVPSGVYLARLEMKAKNKKAEAVTIKLLLLK